VTQKAYGDHGAWGLAPQITAAGQVSIPAEIRERCGVANVLIRDEGDHIVLTPVADDPVEALRGILEGKARASLTSTDAVRLWREDNASSDRKLREHYGG
jgi:AbrB family looped-hinge helix DNA binding protein